MRLHCLGLTAFGAEFPKGLLRVQVPISTNPILPTPGESGLLLETIQIRITIDPEPRNVKRAMEVRQRPSVFDPDSWSGKGHPGNMSR